MKPLLDPALEKTMGFDRHALENTAIPIVTISASFKEDIKEQRGLKFDPFLPDVVFSRAHYSMASGIAVEAWGKGMDEKKAWVVDPTNYVSSKDWRSIILTERIAKTLARRPLLKTLKDFVDRFLRSRLPIIENITPPLLELTKGVKAPILSLHIAAGNVLVEHGRTVVQVITDPHVRYDYLKHANSKKITYCVFDKKTKTDFLEQAGIAGIDPHPDQVIITGPPIDPRIVAARNKKIPYRSGAVNLLIATGGLGTNKSEIRTMLRQLLPEMRKRPTPYNLMIYAGTHKDICKMVRAIAKEERTPIGKLEEKTSRLRLIYHPQIVNANELLIKHGFPWAEGVISKPSGDMAYDAAAAGCFLLTLREWGVWEENIEQFFEQRGIARVAEAMHIVDQLEVLKSSQNGQPSWIESAMRAAENLDPLYLNGAEKIIEVYKQVKKTPS